MKRYIFNEIKIKDEYTYIFLCGVRYSKDICDKRNVLQRFLNKTNGK